MSDLFPTREAAVQRIATQVLSHRGQLYQYLAAAARRGHAQQWPDTCVQQAWLACLLQVPYWHTNGIQWPPGRLPCHLRGRLYKMSCFVGLSRPRADAPAEAWLGTTPAPFLLRGPTIAYCCPAIADVQSDFVYLEMGLASCTIITPGHHRHGSDIVGDPN